MCKDLISIIMPAYNSSEFISQSICSVINQNYTHWELIVVDDSSSDNTSKIIGKFAKKDNRIKPFTLKENSGVSFSRNFGTRNANGKYIAFIDSDDIWMENKLSVQINFLKLKKVPFTYSAYDVIDEKDNIISIYNPSCFIDYRLMLKGSQIGCSTVMYDSSLLGYLLFPECGNEDYALWLKILKKYGPQEGVELPLVKYRIRENSRSANKYLSARNQWMIYKKEEKLSFLTSTYYFIHYAIKGFFKYKRNERR